MQHKQEFTIFPAIHIRNGRVIRFTSGDLATATVYSSDPVACARNWIEQGATWLQLVNIDAAFDEEAAHNWKLVEEICQLDVNVQFGGGIRTLDDIDWAIHSGSQRVIIGTAAVENPHLMAEALVKYGADQIVLAIDSDKTGQIRTHGWKTSGQIEAISFGRQMRQLGVTTAVYTNVHRDGSMTGVDWQSAAQLASYTGLNIIAGGGVADYDDIVACYHQEGITGVLVGRALYTNKIHLNRALNALKLKLSFDTSLPKWKASQQTPWAKLRYNLVQQNLQKHLPTTKPLQILDAGSGNGRDAIPLAQMGHHVTLLDPSQAMLNDAGVLADEFQVADMVSYHLAEVKDIAKLYPTPQFDVVLCHEVLQFIDEPEPFLAALVQPLKGGGLLSLMSFNRYSLPLRAAFFEGNLEHAHAMLDERKQLSDTFDTTVDHYAGDEITQLLQTLGIVVDQHYGIRCLYDYWGTNEQKHDPQTGAALMALEMALTDRHPYNLMARYFQIIAHKPRAGS